MLVINAMIEGESVAPAIPSSARAKISTSGVGEKAARTEAAVNAAADHQYLAAADAVAQCAHRDQEPRQHETIDVHDPEHLGAVGLERDGEMRQRQQQHRDVDGNQQCGQCENGKSYPFTGTGFFVELGVQIGGHEKSPSGGAAFRRLSSRKSISARANASGAGPRLARQHASSLGSGIENNLVRDGFGS